MDFETLQHDFHGSFSKPKEYLRHECGCIVVTGRMTKVEYSHYCKEHQTVADKLYKERMAMLERQQKEIEEWNDKYDELLQELKVKERKQFPITGFYN